MPKAIIVGSGPGGSVMAMELAEAGWDVVIFEMGPSYYTNIEGQGPFGTVFSNDELKSQYRYFEQPDPLAYPRTFRQMASQNAANTYVGDVNDLPNQVGGAFPHSDVKVTRMWDIDFKGLSLLGPVPGADMADWPFEYSELAPYYDEVETVIGVQGDVASIPAFVQRHQPQSRALPDAARGTDALVDAACRGGEAPWDCIPFRSRWRPIRSNTTAPRLATTADSVPGYGCPISAKPVNLIMLRRALHTGRAHLRPQTTVTQVNYTGRRATGVSFIDAAGNAGGESADVVVLSCSAVLTPRLALLSNLPDPYGRIGKRIMFQNFYDGFAIFLNQRVHAYRGRSNTQVMFDFNDPDFPGARVFARLAGLPYIRAGLCELGGQPEPDRGRQVLPGDPGAYTGRAVFRQHVQGADARIAAARPARRRRLFRHRHAVPDQ